MDEPVPSDAADPKRVLYAGRLKERLGVRQPRVEVDTVRVLDATDGSASRVRIAVAYGEGHDAGLPATIFVKRNLERFNFPSEMYSTEVRIYRDVLPAL